MEKSNVIDYREIYGHLKDMTADDSKQMTIFEKLYDWKLNDPREDIENEIN